MTLIKKKCCALAWVCLGVYTNLTHADIYIDTHQADAIVISSQPNEQQNYIKLESTSNNHQSFDDTRLNQLPFHQEVLYAATETKLEPALIHAVIAAESNHNPSAISVKGAAGLMQLMPKTAKQFGVNNILDPEQNILAGSQYLSALNKTYKGNIALALAAYNAGPASVKKYGGRIPPYKETQHYVPKVLQLYQDYAKQLNRVKKESFS